MMNQSEELENTWMSAQRLLARREHSRLELQQKLLKKKFSMVNIRIALEELTARGWLDDQKFCLSYVRYRVQRGQGPLKIIHELKLKGVAPHIIFEELQNYDAQWLQLCENVLEKKYAGKITPTLNEKAKRYRFLNTRGFPVEIISQLLD